MNRRAFFATLFAPFLARFAPKPSPILRSTDFVSYRFTYCAVVLNGPGGLGGTYKYKVLDSPSTIGL